MSVRSCIRLVIIGREFIFSFTYQCPSLTDCVIDMRSGKEISKGSGI